MSESLLGPQVNTGQAAAETQTTQSTNEVTVEQSAQQTTETNTQTSTEQKTETKVETKQEEKKPEGPPENYEFKLPDGVQLDTALVEKATPLFKELNLTQEQAQKLVGLQAESIKASIDEWQKTTDGWRDQTLKEYGGNWDKEKVFGAKFRDQFIDKDTADFMDKMGLFNHPGIIRMMIKGGKMIAEDPLVDTKPTTGDSKSAAQVLYPNMK